MRKITFRVIILSIIVFLLIPTYCNSSTDVDVTGYAPELAQQSEFDDIGGTILGAVQAVGSFASIIVLVVIGIKYMVGSIEEKAEYKKSMIPYIIGAIFVFASSNIAKILYDVGTSIQ